jgi:hypothetical protein
VIDYHNARWKPETAVVFSGVQQKHASLFLLIQLPSCPVLVIISEALGPMTETVHVSLIGAPE